MTSRASSAIAPLVHEARWEEKNIEFDAPSWRSA